MALSLVGLVVTVLVARPVAAVGRHVPGSLARFGSAVVSPVRSFATVGLADALAALAEQAPVPVEVVVPKLQLPPGVEAVAYFVCSEALANIAKHASASRVSVSVTTGDGRVRIEVEDDGLGGADPARGTGLRGLADRVEALGGTLDVESPAGGGTRVAAEVPFGGEAA